MGLRQAAFRVISTKRGLPIPCAANTFMRETPFAMPAIPWPRGWDSRQPEWDSQLGLRHDPRKRLGHGYITKLRKHLPCNTELWALHQTGSGSHLHRSQAYAALVKAAAFSAWLAPDLDPCIAIELGHHVRGWCLTQERGLISTHKDLAWRTESVRARPFPNRKAEFGTSSPGPQGATVLHTSTCTGHLRSLSTLCEEKSRKCHLWPPRQPKFAEPLKRCHRGSRTTALLGRSTSQNPSQSQNFPANYASKEPASKNRAVPRTTALPSPSPKPNRSPSLFSGNTHFLPLCFFPTCDLAPHGASALAARAWLDRTLESWACGLELRLKERGTCLDWRRSFCALPGCSAQITGKTRGCFSVACATAQSWMRTCGGDKRWGKQISPLRPQTGHRSEDIGSHAVR